jgi:hypothetical protein
MTRGGRGTGSPFPVWRINVAIIDICNAALAKNHYMEPIPDTADLDYPTGKAQTVCARFITQSRRTVLRMGPWTCVMKRTPLTKDAWEGLTDYEAGDRIAGSGSVFECTSAGTSGAAEPAWPSQGTVVDGTGTWTWRYDVLADLPDYNYTGLAYAFCIPDDYLMQIEVRDESGVPVHFEMERGVLYADEESPVLNYVPDEEDDGLYDPMLREIVITQLAGSIAYPLTNSHENEVAFSQAAAAMAQAAFKKTRREKRQGPPSSEPWMDGVFDGRYIP